MVFGIVPISEIWEDIEHALRSGTHIPYPVVVGLAKLSSGNFWTKAGIMIPDGFWITEGDWPGVWSAGPAPSWSSTSASYEDITTEDFILPAGVKNVSGHAFVACYFIFNANTGTGGNSSTFRINAQMFKMDSAGNETLEGTSDASAGKVINSLDSVTAYMVAMPHSKETEVSENERLGLRIILQGKREAGTGNVSIGWNLHVVDGLGNYLKRSYAMMPIRI